MRTLLHFLIILGIILTASIYALNPTLTLAGLDSGILTHFRESLPADLAEVFSTYVLTLPLWQGLMGTTLLIFLFSRLLRSA